MLAVCVVVCKMVATIANQKTTSKLKTKVIQDNFTISKGHIAMGVKIYISIRQYKGGKYNGNGRKMERKKRGYPLHNHWHKRRYRNNYKRGPGKWGQV